MVRVSAQATKEPAVAGPKVVLGGRKGTHRNRNVNQVALMAIGRPPNGQMGNPTDQATAERRCASACEELGGRNGNVIAQTRYR